MAGNQILVRKAVITWAREAIGFSVSIAAEKTKIKRSLLERWEAEDSEIPIPDIKKLAKAYKLPLTFFYLKNPPQKDIVPPDFRTLDSVKIETLSVEARMAIRRAQRNRKFFAQISRKEDLLRNKALTFSFGSGIEKLVPLCREFLGVTLDTQIKWLDENFALNDWIDAIEKQSIPVFQMELPLKEFRGFCLRGNSLPPVIVVNSRDAASGRIFTLIHELYHLLLEQKDIDLLERTKGIEGAHKLVEMKANEFAGSFLVPNEHFLENPITKLYLKTGNDECITRLRNIYKVSSEVIYRRLLFFNYISQKDYERKIEVLKNSYEQRKTQEKEKREKENRPFMRNYYRDVVTKRTGYALGNTAFSAVSEGKITTYELVSFLDVKLSSLNKVQGYIEAHYKPKTG